jgi:hypothetical protein
VTKIPIGSGSTEHLETPGCSATGIPSSHHQALFSVTFQDQRTGHSLSHASNTNLHQQTTGDSDSWGGQFKSRDLDGHAEAHLLQSRLWVSILSSLQSSPTPCPFQNSLGTTFMKLSRKVRARLICLELLNLLSLITNTTVTKMLARLS